MGKLTRVFKPVDQVTSQEWQLIKNKALQVVTTADGIIESLRERQQIAMYFSEGDIVGVSTVDTWPCEFQGVKTVAMYTGNVWYHPDFRRQNLTQYLALQCIFTTKLRYPRHLCYWVYGSSNYKSYLIMVKNFRKFWPRYDRETPPWELAYLRLMTERFYHHAWTTGAYGLVPNDHGRSFPSSETKIPPELQDDPHLQFYQGVNPDYVNGCRLICGAPFDVINVSLIIGHTLLRAGRLLRHRRP